MALAIFRCSAILTVVAVAAAAEAAATEAVQDAACGQEENIDYFGNDIGDVVNVNSAALCQLHCQDVPACRYFTWNGDSKRCILKDSAAGRRPYPDAISGPRACAACNQELNIDYNGNDIGDVAAVSTPALCQLHCQDVPACLFFTWNGDSKRCILKDSASGRRPYPNAVSGPRACTWTAALESSAAAPEEAQGAKPHRSLQKGVAQASAADDTERLPKAPSSKAANSTKREEGKGCACQGTNGYCYKFSCNGWCQDYACGCYSGYPCRGDDGMCYAYDCGWYCSTSWCLSSALLVADNSSVAPETAALESSAATPEDSTVAAGRLRGTSAGFCEKYDCTGFCDDSSCHQVFGSGFKHCTQGWGRPDCCVKDTGSCIPPP